MKKLEKNLAKLDHWKNIVVHTKNGWGIYEGFFDKNGKRLTRTKDSISFDGYETKKELKKALLLTLYDL